VRRNLRGGPGLHEVAGDAAPVTLNVKKSG
jgi:hypothetical protein